MKGKGREKNAKRKRRGGEEEGRKEGGDNIGERKKIRREVTRC